MPDAINDDTWEAMERSSRESWRGILALSRDERIKLDARLNLSQGNGQAATAKALAEKGRFNLAETAAGQAAEHFRDAQMFLSALRVDKGTFPVNLRFRNLSSGYRRQVFDQLLASPVATDADKRILTDFAEKFDKLLEGVAEAYADIDQATRKLTTEKV